MRWTENYFLTILLNVAKYMLKEMSRTRESREKIKKENILAIQKENSRGELLLWDISELK